MASELAEGPPENPSTSPVPEPIRLEREKRLRGLGHELRDFPDTFDLEIGCGHGHWMVGYAESHPERFIVGIDLMNRRLALAMAKSSKRKLGNCAFVKAEALEFLEVLRPSGKRLERIFVFFPDPWPKRRHWSRRFFQKRSLDLLGECADPGAALFFRTDHGSYFEWTRELIRASSFWEETTSLPWPYESASFFQNLLPDYQSLIAHRFG